MVFLALLRSSLVSTIKKFVDSISKFGPLPKDGEDSLFTDDIITALYSQCQPRRVAEQE